MRLGGQIVYGLWLVQLLGGAALLDHLRRHGLLLRYAGLALFLAVHLVRGITLAAVRHFDSAEVYSALFVQTNWVTLASIAALTLHALHEYVENEFAAPMRPPHSCTCGRGGNPAYCECQDWAPEFSRAKEAAACRR